jgi:DNA-directed RNA polymerase subunit RPC12/RpoP
MPIRFRCPHCNQRLGIARRKAGTEVQCPKCQALVLVPPTDMEGIGDAAAPPPAPPAPLVFERSDFEDYLKEPLHQGPAHPIPDAEPFPDFAAAPPEPAPHTPAAPPAFFPPPAPPPSPPGLFLSPTQATILTVIAILLLALAFGAGLCVGRFL